MSDFNKLELAILDWLKRTYKHKGLSDQVNTAKFVKREWTKVGFFVYFEVSEELDPLNIHDLGGAWPIEGPLLESGDVEYGGDTIIWGKDGYIDCIEMYAWGNYFNEQVTDFELKDKNLKYKG